MIKKVSLNIFLGTVISAQTCVAHINTKIPLNQTIKNITLQGGQLKCEINDFGPPKHDSNLPVGKQTIYDFNLDIYITGWDYNFWAETLKVIRQNPDLQKRKDFFNEFLGDQGTIFPYLFAWSAMIQNLHKKLENKAIEVVDKAGHDKEYFRQMLYFTFIRSQENNFWKWFWGIFLVWNVETYNLNVGVNERDRFVSELRENGAIFRIPFLAQVFSHERYPLVRWYVGSGMQMFPQDEVLINRTLVLSYFYTSPRNTYSEEIFRRILPTIKIKLDRNKPLIKDNKKAILKALQTIMHIVLHEEDLGIYLGLNPETENKQVTNEPALFNVDFFRFGAPPQAVYATLPFYVQGTNGCLYASI